ncbi:hypothetical protein [Bacillus amyloliquefaciens]|uniref:hypothetical protein n=1 Tax=Bacillus amyloliquefaciens TaxID=1390 RepID=UPI00155ED28A|nr:hypothetical protein [Bacillus amyloliquefaciens]
MWIIKKASAKYHIPVVSYNRGRSLRRKINLWQLNSNYQHKQRLNYSHKRPAKHWQMMGTQTVTEDAQTVVFNLPKVRLLSQILVEFDATVSLKSANAAIPTKPFSPYQIIRNIALELNSGFRPFVVSGEALHLYSLNRLNPDVLLPASRSAGIILH